MKYAAFLIFGIFLGYMLGHRAAEPAVKVVEVEKECAPAQADAITVKSKKVAVEPVKISLTGALKTAPPVVPTYNAAGSPSPVPHKRELTITSSQVARMEREWNNLYQQMRLKREDGGWRIVYLKDYSIFTESGLRQGDLITDTALQEMRRHDTNNEGLADRFYTVLNYLVY